MCYEKKIYHLTSPIFIFMGTLIMHRLKIGFFVVILLYGCGPNIKEPKVHVTKNVTMYTGNLKCLGKQIKKSDQAFKVTAAVGKIQDKTGKAKGLGKPLTQAASDMALTALSRLNAMDIVAPIDTNDLLHLNIEKHNPTPTKLELKRQGNIGGTFKSQFYLTGAITEYNEDLGEKSGGLDIFRKYLDLGISGSDEVFSVAMDLRLVGSTTGTLLKNQKQELLALSLKNDIHVKDFNGVLFRIFNAGLEKGGGINYGFRISDPKHLAVREIIEKAVFILIGKLYEVPFEQCEMTTPGEAKLGGAVAQYMSKQDQGYAQQVLEVVPTKELAEWESVDIQYTMLSTKTYNKDDSTPCREYYITTIRGNRKEGSKGTACRQPNGVWKDV
ncbi:MAG: hypothetical protein DRR19_23900 [Candidatus Parabeggiatoa sp. nov. 1]|nr:MAG: hypothetical protein DRR19_23900 [Gammaproteobacteria bacterium]